MFNSELSLFLLELATEYLYKPSLLDIRPLEVCLYKSKTQYDMNFSICQLFDSATLNWSSPVNSSFPFARSFSLNESNVLS